MSTFTTNYSYEKPADTDFADNTPLNSNFDAIDTDLKAVSDRVTVLETRGLIVKASDETVTNSTTMQDDNDFSITVVSGKKYVVRAMLVLVSASAAGDFKVGFTHPGGDTTFTAQGPNNADLASGSNSNGEWVARIDSASPTSSIPVGSSASVTAVAVDLYYNCTANGTLKLQWAQNSANATGTTMKAKSWLKWEAF